MRVDRVLAVMAAVHVVVALGCALWLLRDERSILGLHPATKPLKFAMALVLFLGSMAWLMPRLSLGPIGATVVRWGLTSAIVVEMIAIVGQALRGRASHFNVATPLDAVQWKLMGTAITVLTVIMVGVALVASLRPLALPPLVAFVTRAALWLFLFSAVSGFAMGGRGQHSVGGTDADSGLPLVNWSRTHGDLRISHFIAMHSLQSLPVVGGLLAAAMHHAVLSRVVAWSLGVGIVVAHFAATIWTLGRALAGRPPW